MNDWMKEDAGVAKDKEREKTQRVLPSKSLEYTYEDKLYKVIEIHE